MKKITPFLWFEKSPEEAVNFYLSIFKNSKLISRNNWAEGTPMPAGSMLIRVVIQIVTLTSKKLSVTQRKKASGYFFM